MDSRLMMEIRQLAEQYCPTQGHHAAGWKAGFCAFAEIVDCLHKQIPWPNVAQPVTSLSSSIWKDETTRCSDPYTSMLDQAIAEHDEIAERNRRAIQIHHELAAERAFATDPHLLQNQLDIRDGKYTIVPSMMSNGLGHSSTYTMTDDEAGSGF